MNEEDDFFRPAMDVLDLAVTIIDNKGIMLYYNRRAEAIIDRKPEHIGTDIHSHHRKTESNEKLDAMLQAFSEGRTEPFQYTPTPYGTSIRVTVSPIFAGGAFLGCVQTVRLAETEAE